MSLFLEQLAHHSFEKSPLYFGPLLSNGIDSAENSLEQWLWDEGKPLQEAILNQHNIDQFLTHELCLVDHVPLLGSS